MIDRLRAPERRLTADAERELARRIEHGDYDARNELILAHVWLVAVNVKHYKDKGLDSEDLMAEGMMGLIDAAEKFGTGRGDARFMTWAMYAVRGAMSRALANYGRTIRKGSLVETRARKGRRARARLWYELGRAPTPGEVAAAIGEPSPVRAESLLAAMAEHGDELDGIPPERREYYLSLLAVRNAHDDEEPDIRELPLTRAEMLGRMSRAVAELRRQLPEVAERIHDCGIGKRASNLLASQLASVVDKLDRVRATQPEVYRAVLMALAFIRADVSRAE